MGLKADELQILIDEITNDPLGRGYGGMTDREVADDLNVEYRTKPRETMTSTEIFQNIDIAEFKALADGPQNNIMAIMSFGVINPFGKEAALFVDIFGAGSNTIQALTAARTVPASRAEELGLPKIGEGDVVDARA